jgi:hypothetical protein
LRAERQVVCEIESKIIKNDQWVDTLCDAAQNLVATIPRLLAGEIAEQTKRIKGLRQKIERLLDQIENGKPIPEIGRRLCQRRNELVLAENELCSIGCKKKAILSVSNRRRIVEGLEELADRLSSASPTDGSVILSRLLMEPISVIPRSVDGKSRQYLQGILRIHSGRLLSLIARMDSHFDLPGNTTILVIDFRSQ